MELPQNFVNSKNLGKLRLNHLIKKGIVINSDLYYAITKGSVIKITIVVKT